MRKKLLQQLKERLEKEKLVIEGQLSKIAEKDPRLKGDWDSKFPKFNGEFGGAALETAADEVEEYDARLSVEFSLETRLRDIDLALEKIKKAAKGEPRQGRGKYGKCEKCAKEIDKKRLEAQPAARFCMACQPR